jgi:hypothetical protein
LGDAACTHNWERFKRRVSEKVDSKFMIAQTTGNALRLLFPAKLLIADEIIHALADALLLTADRVGYSHCTF